MAERAPDFVSVIVPAYNEAESIAAVAGDIQGVLRRMPCASEVIVVDDASRDQTALHAALVPGVRVVRNPVNLGYGHSLLRGMAAARGNLIAICDGDGTYRPDGIPLLYDWVQRGADHAIGQRTGDHVHDRWLARRVYRWLCSYVVGCRVPDANSGLRLFRRELVERLRSDLCLGFSFTTSLTLASLMTGYVVAFQEIPYGRRVGPSHVRFRDTLRTAQYLFQLVAAYNPIKLFLPIVAASGLLAGVALTLSLLGVWPAGGLAAAVLGAAALVLVGLAAHAYVVARVGLGRLAPGGLSTSGVEPGSDRRRRSDRSPGDRPEGLAEEAARERID